MNLLKTITFMTVLAISNNSFASVFKVFDALIDQGQFEKMMTSRGIFDKAVVGQVSKDVRYSLEDISSSKVASLNEIKNLGKSITSPEDKAKFESLISNLGKDSKEITKEELVATINDLVLLSQRYGVRNKAILACAPCVNKDMSDAGFNFTLNELKDAPSQRIFKEMNKKAKDPISAVKFINSEMKRQKLGEIPKGLSATDEEALIYFLLIPRHGSDEQKSLFNSIIAASKNKAGVTDLFDADNGHKLFNIFSDSLSSSELKLWDDLMSDTTKSMKEEQLGTMDAFYSVLERRAEGVTDQAEKHDLMAKLDFIKREGCFSRK